MFIHWGAYAVPAGTHNGERIPGIGEWIMSRAHIPIPEYEQYVHRFNPARFDADEWVRIAKDAGMKYIVITSKHHDGFAIFDSKVSRYDIMDAAPYQRDAIQALSEAAHRAGLKFGVYYSIMDWHHPDAQGPNYPDYNSRTWSNPNFGRYVDAYMKPQIRELLTQYPYIDVLWFDGEWIADWNDERGRDLYNYVRALRPSLIVNNRVGHSRQGLSGLNKEGHVDLGDFGTPEQQVPPEGLPGVDWETCMTMNDTWGFKSYDDDWKDTRTLLRTLIDVASKGGNFLLNVGPTAEGVIPTPIVWRRRQMGDWMKTNGGARERGDPACAPQCWWASAGSKWATSPARPRSPARCWYASPRWGCAAPTCTSSPGTRITIATRGDGRSPSPTRRRSWDTRSRAWSKRWGRTCVTYLAGTGWWSIRGETA